ncbi:GNAT family N-acetyltransferase [Agromyces soli]
MSSDFRAFPVDQATAKALGERGLEYRLIDPADRDALANWSQADQRGFHHPRPTAELLEREIAVLRERRVHAVHDATLAEASVPVATVASWPTGLSVPGGRSVDGWAIGSVTVAPTHRRRGVARAIMQGELANARTAGAAVAMLTATEATLYGRYGFAPAARTTTLEIDRARVEWIGDDVAGRVQFVEPAAMRPAAAQIVRRSVARTPGEIDRWPALIDHVLGLDHPDGERARGVRVARYDDARGLPQGFVAFRMVREGMGAGVLEFDFLAAATDDAERALWRFLVEQDFVRLVRAKLRSVDEPLRWLLADPRAITTTELADHLWLRILDPVAALEARRYAGPGSLVLELDDPLGHATGRYALEVSAKGVAEVSRLDGPAGAAGAANGAGGAATSRADASARRTANGAPLGSSRRSKPAQGLRLGVDALAAMYLGDTRASLLARAGRIEEHGAGSLAVADALFATSRAPRLSIWF